MLSEPEITAPTALVDSSGRLNPAAVGWMRQPLIDTSGIGRARSWSRNKRWEYWNVVTPTHILALTVSSIDYAAIHEVWVFDRRTEESWGESRTDPLSRPFLPPTLGRGDIRVTSGNLSIAIDEHSHGTRLRAKIPGAAFDVFVELPPRHERLGVVVPWSHKRFQYTVKDICRPASGWVAAGGIKEPVPEGQSWGVLDHGRGRWPYSIDWNWGAASGTLPAAQILFAPEVKERHPHWQSRDHVFGLQLGARWTAGTGVTENSLYLDGTIHKISEELDWSYDLTNWQAPWHIGGTDIDLEFTPFYNKRSSTDLGVLVSRTDQCFGTYQGVVRIPEVGTVLVTDLVGWAEDVHNQW